MCGNLWGNSYIPCLLLIITFLFTCGEKKICSSIKMSQNIMNIVVALFDFLRTPRYFRSRLVRSKSYLPERKLGLTREKMVIAWHVKTFKSSQPDVLCEKGVVKNFAIFTGKHLCWSLFLIKMQAWRSEDNFI